MYDSVTEKCEKYSFLLDFGDADCKNVKRFVKGKDEYLYDEEGKKYLDLSSQYINNNIGYNNSKIIESIDLQLRELHYVKPLSPSKARAELCEKIITEIAPDNMAKVFLTLGGSDANELAIRMAISATGRNKIMSQYYSYHGASFGAANLGGTESLLENLETHHFVHFLGYNAEKIRDLFDDEDKYIDYLLVALEEQILAEGSNKIAAIFFETIGLGNLIVPSPRYYQQVRKICDKYGILLVFDEVAVGFGRTGKWFAFEHFNVKPDMITLAKGITSSYYPVGAVIVSDKVAEKVIEKGYKGAFTASFHPVGCAAALASIQEIQNRNLIENAKVMGKYLEDRLQELIESHMYLREIRGIGLLYGIRLIKELEKKPILSMICEKLFEKGYYTWVQANTYIFISPPITIKKKQIDDIIETLNEILSKLEEEKYLDLIRKYPEVYWEYENFYHPDVIVKMLQKLNKFHKILFLGCANENMLNYIGSILTERHQQKVTLLVNKVLESKIHFDAKLVLYQSEDKMDLQVIDKILDKLFLENFDCVLIPQYHKQADYSNIYSIAKVFDLPTYIVSIDGICSLME